VEQVWENGGEDVDAVLLRDQAHPHELVVHGDGLENHHVFRVVEQGAEHRQHVLLELLLSQSHRKRRQRPKRLNPHPEIVHIKTRRALRYQHSLRQLLPQQLTQLPRTLQHQHEYLRIPTPRKIINQRDNRLKQLPPLLIIV